MSSSSSPSPVGNRQDSEPIVVVLAVALVLLLVLAAVAFRSANIASPSPPPPPPKNDGPTLYQAIAPVNQSVENLTGGPWALFSIYGIAAQAPYSPNVESYPLENQTVNACQAQFNGLTLWNGTMPVFNGTPDSGTAPFWQFGFYSNLSHQILLVTNVLDSVHVYAPMPVNGSCHPWYDLGNDPEVWVQELSPFLPNSPSVATSALKAITPGWVSQGSSIVEIFTTGPGVFDGFGDLGGGAGLILERCGLLDVTGIQPLLLWGESLQGTNGSYSIQTTNCAFLNHPYFAGYGTYGVISLPTNETTFAKTAQFRAPFQVALIFHDHSGPTNYDGWGLASWMTSWNITTSSGQRLQMGTSTCKTWVVSVTACIANSSGWFAVILSAGGGWVNSYGALPGGGAGWSQPVTAIVSNQQLVIVLPSSWNLSGDQLNVSTTVSTSSIIGSVAL
jgi:hypothetical protein